MRIVQVLSSTATIFEHKCQRIDFRLLQAEHDVTCVTSFAVRGSQFAEPDLIHFYGEKSRVARPKRHLFARQLAIAVSPLENVPEAVEDPWFESPQRRTANSERRTVGWLARKAVRNMVEQTAARLHRTREDIEFLSFDEPPTPEELGQIGVWVDPAIDEQDFDGFVAEAIVSGVPVAASRTPINAQRLENGRTGFLVPPKDPNELAHAILSALFKPEVAQQKIEAARQTMAKFRPRQRLRALSKLYESLFP